MSETALVQCPLDDCEWTHLETTPDVDPDALMRQFAAVLSRQNIETELRRHFASHQVVDYLRTITRIQADNVRLAAEVDGLRDHIGRYIGD